MHEATPGECTLRDRSCRYYIQDDFFCHLAGPVAPTGKAIVHWIGCINAIKTNIRKNIPKYCQQDHCRGMDLPPSTAGEEILH